MSDFTVFRLRDGRTVKALIEGLRPPVSRETLLHMILAASLLLEEAEPCVYGPNPKLARRMELLRKRLEDAMERER